MLYTTFAFLLGLHVFLGAIALASFWIPIFARKRRGGAHTRFGQIFAWAMMGTAASAAIVATMTIIAPLATHPDDTQNSVLGLRLVAGLMLAYLAAITFVSAYSGLRAVRLRGNHAAHRAPGEISANVIALVLAIATMASGLYFGVTLMVVLSLIGLLGVPGNFLFIYRKPRTRQDWLYQHMGSMLGAGIAAHTAFLVFGLSNVAPALTFSPLAWLTPTLIGVPGTFIWQRHYRKKFESRATAMPRPVTEALAE